MNTQRIIALVLLVALMGASLPAAANAQTYYFNQPYQARTVQEQIAYLYGVIAQLQLQLALLQRTGTVRGIDYDDDFRRADIEIDTNSARDVEDDEATLRGEVDLNGASFARVWFEYGEDGDLDERTSTVRIERRGDDTRSFSRVVDDLEEDEVYYFRAVGEGPDGSRDFGQIRAFRTDDDFADDDDDGDEPDARTRSADDVDEDSAVLRGEVDMNDFRNGIVFFVYGEDEDHVEGVERDFDSYSDVDEDGDDLQKVRVDSDLDGRNDYRERVSGLVEDTDHFFSICVEYEDDDGDEQLACGSVAEFTTGDDGDNGDSGDRPEVTTGDAFDIDDGAASLEGEVDRNGTDSVYAFFVFGEDENDVEDATEEDEYSDIERDGSNVNKTGVRGIFSENVEFNARIFGLDDDTRYFYVACAEYEDDDDDTHLECGDIEDFRTDD